MEKYDVKFKKKFGQNFLKDVNVVKRIVSASGVDKNSLVTTLYLRFDIVNFTTKDSLCQ